MFDSPFNGSFPMEQLSSITISPFAVCEEHERLKRKCYLTHATNEEIISEMLQRFVIPQFYTRELEFDDVDEICEKMNHIHIL